MSDAEWDRLFRELQQIEQTHPELRTSDSPTHRIGAEPASALVKHKHRVPMLSLANAFDDDELRAWEARITKLAPEVKSAGFLLEPKVDGAAVSLTYDDGQLRVGATRGNGTIGEDVTTNIRTIPDIPLQLRDEHWPRSMEIRGEVYFPLASFARLNDDRRAEDLPVFANPRNAAAGSLRQLDSRITRSRHLRFFAFHVVTGETLPIETQHEVLEALERWGFRTVPNHVRVGSMDEAVSEIANLEKVLADLPFEADGVVVKVDRIALHRKLGVIGGREPRWQIARKFAPEVATTMLLDIGINIGRTGTLNPYAILEPVEVTGVTVSHATLHNFDLIEAKDIRIGDYVEVTRAGEVIPQVLGPLRERRTGNEEPFEVPTHCPACGTPVERLPDEVMYYCPNVACSGRVLESIIHFASRGAMDIRTLGEQRVIQLREAGLLDNVASIYDLTIERLLPLEGFGQKAATQLVDAIEESKQQPFSVLLFALGIRHVGSTVAKLLARQFGDLDALMKASEDEIASISGVGPTIANAVATFFEQPANRDLVERLRAHGLTFTEPTTGTSDVLAGLTFVITGTLPNLSRAEAQQLIEDAGGKVVSSISTKTTAVVYGDSPGSKLDKARKLGIATIDEEELLRRVGARF